MTEMAEDWRTTDAFREAVADLQVVTGWGEQHTAAVIERHARETGSSLVIAAEELQAAAEAGLLPAWTAESPDSPP